MTTNALLPTSRLLTLILIQLVASSDVAGPISQIVDESNVSVRSAESSGRRRAAARLSGNLGGSKILDCNIDPDDTSSTIPDHDYGTYDGQTGESLTPVSITGNERLQHRLQVQQHQMLQQHKQQSVSEHIMTWRRDGHDVPIFIQFDGYPPHVDESYHGRIRLVETTAIEVTDLRVQDEGWYECSIFYLEGGGGGGKTADVRGNNVGGTGSAAVNSGSGVDASLVAGHDGTVINGTWIYLTINVPPVLGDVSPTFLIQKEGDTVDLFCDATATPAPTLSWRKDSRELAPNERIRVSGNRVQVRRLERTDGGAYSCTFSNVVGQVTHTIRLVVEGNAYIMVPPTNTTATEESRVKLTCQAEGYPNNITYRWFRDGVDVTLYQRGGGFAGSRGSTSRGQDVAGLGARASIYADGSLVITSASADDSGWYTCRPTNGLGLPPEASAFLNVTYLPRVLAMPSRVYLARGLTGRVDCPVDANPPATLILWSRNGRTIDITSDGVDGRRKPRLRITQQGSLVIRAVEPGDEGRYACTPYSPLGKGQTSTSVVVVVRDAPTFIVRPNPVYQRQPGQSVKMPCVVDGDPVPAVTWRKIDGNFPPSTRTMKEIGNLTIVELERFDQGLYECVASNNVVVSVTSTLLIVEDESSHAATNVTAEMTDSTARVCWLPAFENGQGLHYVLWYLMIQNTTSRSQNFERWRTMYVVPNDTTCTTVHQLQPGTAYQFMVLSRNQIGDALFSRPIAASTLDADDDDDDIIDANVDGDGTDDDGPEADGGDYNNNDGDDDEDNVDTIVVSAHPPGPSPSANAELDHFEFGVPNTGPRPSPPLNLTVRQQGSELLITWSAPLSSSPTYVSSSRRHDVTATSSVTAPVPSQSHSSATITGPIPVERYVLQYRTVGQWVPLVDRIAGNVTSHRWRASRGATYHFRVFAVSKTARSEPSVVASVKTSDPMPNTSSLASNSTIGGLIGVLLSIALSVIVIAVIVRLILNRRQQARSARYGNIKYFGTHQADANHVASGNDRPKHEGYASEVFTTADLTPTPPATFNHRSSPNSVPIVDRRLKETPI